MSLEGVWLWPSNRRGECCTAPASRRKGVVLPPTQGQPLGCTHRISNNKTCTCVARKHCENHSFKIIVTHCFDICHGLSRGEPVDISPQSTRRSFGRQIWHLVLSLQQHQNHPSLEPLSFLVTHHGRWTSHKETAMRKSAARAEILFLVLQDPPRAAAPDLRLRA